MDSARARELLAKERSRIEKAIDDVESEQRDDAFYDDQHGEDRSSDLAREELEGGQVETLRKELDAVERAEERLAAGTYGLSVESGEPIPDERLEAVPWAERTVGEQERYDRGL
ncbi:MAG: TraR/DksA family transcriptional regulator [Gaiellaceae bacterium]